MGGGGNRVACPWPLAAIHYALVVLLSLEIPNLVSASTGGVVFAQAGGRSPRRRQLPTCQGLKVAWLSTRSLRRSSIAWRRLYRKLSLPAAPSAVVA
ncbi:hypothetical protein F5883DRAFT_123358 [Diaporthe sp. PMI_573]|nr:hypothetical protein F5883DRAFT_123358 [Diaporthaceae sp. PMI_573]